MRGEGWQNTRPGAYEIPSHALALALARLAAAREEKEKTR